MDGWINDSKDDAVNDVTTSRHENSLQQDNWIHKAFHIGGSFTLESTFEEVVNIKQNILILNLHFSL